MVEWIAVLQDGYGVLETAATDITCQKRAVCEIWRPENRYVIIHFFTFDFCISFQR